MTNKVLVTFPAFTFDNLCGRSATVHGMRWHQILTIGRPRQTQYVRSAAAILERFRYRRLAAPVVGTPNSNASIVALRSEEFSNLKLQLCHTNARDKHYLNLELIRSLTGSQVTPLTSPVWPFRIVTIAGRFSMSHTITVLSTLQLANHLSHGDQAKSRISPICSK